MAVHTLVLVSVAPAEALAEALVSAALSEALALAALCFVEEDCTHFAGSTVLLHQRHAISAGMAAHLDLG